jgi:hypothetical protein
LYMSIKLQADLNWSSSCWCCCHYWLYISLAYICSNAQYSISASLLDGIFSFSFFISSPSLLGCI